MKRQQCLTRTPPTNDNQHDLFVPYIQDIPIKDFGDMMIAPLLYNGDHKGSREPLSRLSYTGNSGTVTVTSDPKGLATIRDFDLILYCISDIMDKINKGLEPTARIQIQPFQFIKFARRNESKSQYDEIENALHRLTATTITAKLKGKSGDSINGSGQHWIDRYAYSRDIKTGRISTLDYTIAEWIYDAIISNKRVLTLNYDYFLLNPQARFIYRLMRKTAGNQLHGWRYSLEELFKLSGTTNTRRSFKFNLRKMLSGGALLDYQTKLEKDPTNGKDYLHFIHVDKLIKLHEYFDSTKGLYLDKIPVKQSKLSLIKPWLSEENYTLLI